VATKSIEYQVQAKLNLLIAIPIHAASLEEAVEASKKLEEADFVDISGDYLDGSMKITGIYQSET